MPNALLVPSDPLVRPTHVPGAIEGVTTTKASSSRPDHHRLEGDASFQAVVMDAAAEVVPSEVASRVTKVTASAAATHGPGTLRESSPLLPPAPSLHLLFCFQREGRSTHVRRSR